MTVKRAAAFFVAIVAIFVILHLIKDVKSRFPYFTTKIKTSSTRYRKVLILSYYRSGSSWFANLLSMAPNTFYLFEPLHLTQVPPTEEGDQLYTGYKLPRLEELYQCGISFRFLRHLKTLPYLYKHPKCNITKCSERMITEHCISSHFINIKTVRLLLSEAENLLIKPSLKNLKIILLVRDPRASMNSLSRMEKQLQHQMPFLCSVLRQNIQSYQMMKPLYEKNIFFVRYEDMARYPFYTTLRVWRFIMGDEKIATIPQEMTNYIEDSVKRDDGAHIGSYDIEKKSTKEWQYWRSMIPLSLLQRTEKECDDVIPTLGYNILGDIPKTRDLSNSVLKQNYCEHIPCKS